MATELTPVTPPAAAESAKPGHKAVGKASDLLVTQEIPANPQNAGMAGTGVDDAAKQKAEGEKVADRLARLAQERKRLDAERATFKAEQEAAKAAAAETAKKAAAWDKLHEAKGKGEHLAALRELFTQDEIDTKLYNELTRDILSREPGDKPLSEAQVRELVAAEREAERQAEAKKAEDAKKAEEAAEAQRSEAARSGYLGVIGDAFEAAAADYPAIAHYKVPSEEVMAFVEKHFADHEDVPEPKAVLDHFEKQLRERHAGAKIPGLTPAPADPLPMGVTPEMTSSATPKVVPTGKRKTPAEIRADWEKTKREHAIVGAA